MSEIYLDCEDLNMIWDTGEVDRFRKLYRSGADIRELAEHFKRTTDEVALLIIDLGNKGQLRGRKP